jgi:hypothetical protein
MYIHHVSFFLVFLPYGEYIRIEFYLNLKYCVDGPMMVVKDRKKDLFVNKT